MAIRKNIVVFMNGTLQKVDLDDKGRVVKGGVKEEVASNKPTREQMIADLKAKGVKFTGNPSNAKLQELYDNADKPSGGTGNQEVI